MCVRLVIVKNIGIIGCANIDKIVILEPGCISKEMSEKAIKMAIDNAYYVKGKSTIGEPQPIPYVRPNYPSDHQQEPIKETRRDRRARLRRENKK